MAKSNGTKNSNSSTAAKPDPVDISAIFTAEHQPEELIGDKSFVVKMEIEPGVEKWLSLVGKGLGITSSKVAEMVLKDAMQSGGKIMFLNAIFQEEWQAERVKNEQQLKLQKARQEYERAKEEAEILAHSLPML